MKDIDILNQLLQGNHLDKQELERAKVIVKQLQINIENRVI
jgi:hypothetical protein